jgi:hypothetical protein
MIQCKIGEKVWMDGYTSFGGGQKIVKITDIHARYDQDTGDPYNVICIDAHHFDSRTGEAINEPTMYYIEKYEE